MVVKTSHLCNYVVMKRMQFLHTLVCIFLSTDLMLAQAQEMVVLKAIRDKMKDQVVAKLCAQCDDLVSNNFGLFKQP